MGNNCQSNLKGCSTVLFAVKIAHSNHWHCILITGSRTMPIVVARSATRREQLAKRHKRVRNSVEGTSDRPRLAVFRSNNHMYAQVIDDEAGNTLAATSTLSAPVKAKLEAGCTNNSEAAAVVGSVIAEMCKEKKIEKVCFDRGGFQYHGRVQALAEAAREAGLSF
jgi:large subunit ribosomal protein L18